MYGASRAHCSVVGGLGEWAVAAENGEEGASGKGFCFPPRRPHGELVPVLV